MRITFFTSCNVHFFESVWGLETFVAHDSPLFFNLIEEAAEQFNVVPKCLNILEVISDWRPQHEVSVERVES
ncbi:MAG: hypothetical protein P8J26_03040 [Pseudomonadales bacterium]|nr:hypothetical protein [Pseudomonadales bacterium]